MPNWTHNVVTITHKKRGVIATLLAGVRAKGELFNFVHPMPENTLRGNLGSDEREMCQREDIPNWYDWCIENWSTKWDACHLDYTRHDDFTVTFNFDTAWCAPYGVYEKLAQDGFEVEAYYVSYENWDAGEWHYDPDHPTDEHDVYIGDLDDGVTDDIDNAFGVSEYLHELAEEVKEMENA